MKKRLSLLLWLLLSPALLLPAQQSCPPRLGPVMPALTPLPGTGGLKAAAPRRFTFIVAGDNRGVRRDCALTLTPTTAMIFRAAPAVHARFVLWLGDTVFGKTDRPADAGLLRQEYQLYLSAARKAGVPVFNAIGNHESDGGSTGGNCVATRVYRQTMGGLFGSFDYGNAHFIALDSAEKEPANAGCSWNPHRKPGEKREHRGYISPSQMAALKADLNAHRHAQHIFILMHNPVVAPDRGELMCHSIALQLRRLLAQYPNVHYVLTAHDHLYYNPQDPTGRTAPDWPATRPARGGALYLVEGAGGAPQRLHPPRYSYLIFTVDGPTVMVKKVRLHPPLQDGPCWQIAATRQH